MGNAIAFNAEVGNGNANAVADMVEASHDATRLRRALVADGVGKAAAALYLALFESPAGLFLRTKFLFYSYYGVLIAVIFFRVAEAWAGFWVSHDLHRRRAVGMTVLWASVLPLPFLAGVGAFKSLSGWWD